VSGEADVVQLLLDHAEAEAALEAAFVCPPMFNLSDDAMRRLILRILVDSARPGPEAALSVEEHLGALALRVAHHATRGRIKPARSRGGLAPAAFRRVEARMQASLDQAGAPTLAELAAAAGLGVTHFVRAFRQHTGVTPHKFLIRRRLDRALSLLRTAKTPIGDVADLAGFSAPAHFVATFRATMGVTPGVVRDALAG
jgi:AraC family transcriptional regulator